MKVTLKLITVFLTVCFIFAGFTTPALAKDKKIKIGYVEWACATASSNTVAEVIDDMGYDVELLPVSAAAMWSALASGDIDALTTAWLPVTHAHYLAKLKDKIVDLGPNCKGAGIGLVVPKYVTIDSIAQLNANADKFNDKIIGIDPGAGIMSKAEQAIKDYKLTKMKLIDSSGAMMTATLGNKIKKKEWVVVTGWTPHWMFARWDLKYLKDPKKVFGGAEYIGTFVRKGLKKDHPDVYKFLDNFAWTLAEIGQQMQWNAEGADPDDSAERWIKENPDRVKTWLK